MKSSILFFTFWLLTLGPLSGQERTWRPQTNILSPNGEVHAVLQTDESLLLGGRFTAIAPYTGGTAVLDPETGQPLSDFPLFSNLSVVLRDGEKGWVTIDHLPSEPLASDYESDGVARILQLEQSGAIRRSWYLQIEPAGKITTALKKGDTLFVSGHFERINGVERLNLAAIDLSSGNVLEWAPTIGRRAASMAVWRNDLIISGAFNTTNSTNVEMIARVDMTTGELHPWEYPLSKHLTFNTFSFGVFRILVSDDVLYTAGGSIYLPDGSEAPWKPEASMESVPGERIWDILIRGDTIYTVGAFVKMNGQKRYGLAAFNKNTGELLPWTPNKGWRPSDSIRIPGTMTMGVGNNRVFVGGTFKYFDGGPVNSLAAVGIESAATASWYPPSMPGWTPRNIGSSVLYADDDAVFVESQWGSVGRAYALRNGFAEINRQTGAVTSWNPGFGSLIDDDGGHTYPHWNATRIRDFLRVGSTLYVAGQFDTVQGEARSKLCAFDLQTKSLLPWHPVVSGIDVRHLLFHDEKLYIAGNFDTVNGTPRRFAAAVDPVSGDLLPWNPEADSVINALAAREGRIYLAGAFQQLGSAPRSCFGVVDDETGEALDEGPVFDEARHVFGMALSESLVYLSGEGLGSDVTPFVEPFNGGYGTGGYDLETGELRWRPQFPVPTNVALWSMQYRDGRILATGTFQTLSEGSNLDWADSSETGMITLDAETGEIVGMGPDLVANDGFLWEDDTLIGWGNMKYVEGYRMPYFAILARQSSDVKEQRDEDAAVTIYPNPTRENVEVHLSMEVMGQSAELYDELGRLCGRGEMRDGRVLFDLQGLPQGTYIVRCGGHTKPFVLIR